MSKSAPSNEQLSKLPHHFQVTFALFCAKQVIHLTENKEAHERIRIVELWLDGAITAEECLAAAAEANYTAAHSTAAYAATTAGVAAAYAGVAAVFAAAYAADGAVYAAFAAGNANTACADPDMKKAQWAFYKELLSFDAAFEKVVLV